MSAENPKRRAGKPSTPEIDKFQSMAWFNTIAHSLGTESPTQLEKLIQPENVSKRADGKTVPYRSWKFYKDGRLPRDGMMPDGKPGAVLAAGQFVEESLWIYRHPIWRAMRSENMTFVEVFREIELLPQYVSRYYIDFESRDIYDRYDFFVESIGEQIWISFDDDLDRSLDHLAVQLMVLRMDNFRYSRDRRAKIAWVIAKTLGPISVSPWLGAMHEELYDWLEIHIWNDIFDRDYFRGNELVKGWRKTRPDWIVPSFIVQK